MATTVTFPDGSTRPVDEETLRGLVTRVEDVPAQSDAWLALSDLVHDVADRFGASAANGYEEADAQEQAIDSVSRTGSGVNNGGWEAMLSWLIAFHGPVVAEHLVDEVLDDL